MTVHRQFPCRFIPFGFLLQFQFLHDQLNLGSDVSHGAFKMENLSSQTIMREKGNWNFG